MPVAADKLCDDEPCADDPCDSEPCDPEPEPVEGGDDGALDPDSGGVAVVFADASLSAGLPMLAIAIQLAHAKPAIGINRRRSPDDTSVIRIVASTPFAR